MILHRFGLVLVLVLVALVAGCSASSANVSGKVTAEGNAVTGGTIIISPIAEDRNSQPGKPGMADIGPDGSFTMQLKAGANGLSKRWTVRFTPPNLPPMPEAEAIKAKIPYLRYTPKMTEVEIKAGYNTLDLELQPPSKRE